MDHEQPEYKDFDSSEGLLAFIREKADDIEKVVIPASGKSIVTFRGIPISALEDLGMVIHTLQHRILVGKSNAEVILKDGILGRMRIKMEVPPNT